MFKLIRSNDKHDFYHDHENSLFNIVDKGMPCGIGGYRLCLFIMQKKGYCSICDMEGNARVKFFEYKEKC